jgi:predicted CXXCH cytochrome family protein
MLAGPRCVARALPLLAGVVLAVLPGPAGAIVANPHNLGACSSCHPVTPRFGVDSGTAVTFTTTADDPALCAPCHQPEQTTHPLLVPVGSGPEGARASLHLPGGSSPAFAGKVVCVSCHSIHAADGRAALLRGFPASAEVRRFTSWNDFCSECHGTNLRRRSPHEGGEGSCAFCHASKPRPERKAEVFTADGELCLVCHADLPRNHSARMSPGKSWKRCLDCHDAHATKGASPGLLTKAYVAAAIESVTVSPHFHGGLCLVCHENVDDYALRAADVNTLCDRCHGSGQIPANIHPLRKVPAHITVPKGWPLTDGALTCLTCHDQGHDDQKRRYKMLHGGPYASARDVCRNCHSSIDLMKSTVHQDSGQDKGCEFCHKTRPVPGRDTIKTVTFIADPDLLCIRCHDEAADDISEHHQLVARRELADERTAGMIPLYKGRVICGSCHNPHQEDARGHRLRDWLVGVELCAGCHRK